MGRPSHKFNAGSIFSHDVGRARRANQTRSHVLNSAASSHRVYIAPLGIAELALFRSLCTLTMPSTLHGPPTPMPHPSTGCCRARNVYCPIILRERSAAKLSRCWRCTQAKKLARRKRARLRLATLVNPAVRGFLARVATRAIREERGRRQRAMLLVSESCLH